MLLSGALVPDGQEGAVAKRVCAIECAGCLVVCALVGLSRRVGADVVLVAWMAAGAAGAAG